MAHPTPTALYDALARPSGGFSMVAVDARESMRAIFRDAGGPDSDADVARFKELVARELGSLASAVLCDPLYGAGAIDAVRTEHPHTGLIVAVDHFDEPRYGPLTESSLDDDAMDSVVRNGGVTALKLYLYWRPDGTPHFREDDARRFVERCRELGVLSLLEGVVKAPGSDPGFGDALVRAADAMGRLGPDLYKTQLPTLGRSDDETVERESRRISDVVGVPWVVLSNGVPPERFLAATGAACRGGASGALVGRAVWREALSSPDPAAELATDGRARLSALNDIVDRHARPWRDAVTH